MVRLYFDIETDRPKKEEAFINEKIIAIGVIKDWTQYDITSIDKETELKLFTEWNLKEEKTIVKDFYEYFGELKKDAEFITVVGFDILRFDIPLTIQKGMEHGIEKLDWLSKFWHDTFALDIFQQLLPANKNMFRGLRLENVREVAVRLGIENIPELYGSGRDVQKWYKEKQYSNVEKHLSRDLEIVRYLELSSAIMKILDHANSERRALFWDMYRPPDQVPKREPIK